MNATEPALPLKLLATVTRRLFIALVLLFASALSLVALFPTAHFVVPGVVIASGFIGGFVGLQRRLRELTHADLELIALPGVFAAGEMLDWEAPTGGYLLTACLASGRQAGQAAARRLKNL